MLSQSLPPNDVAVCRLGPDTNQPCRLLQLSTEGPVTAGPTWRFQRASRMGTDWHVEHVPVPGLGNNTTASLRDFSKVQWSVYVPHSGHNMYHTVVTICIAQWSLYILHSGHYMYRTVVIICTNSLTFSNSMFSPHSVFMCFEWISEQTAIISLYSIN